MTANKPTDTDLLGCAGVSKLHGNAPAIFGTADIRRFAECVLKNWGQPAMPADAEFQITQDGFIVAGAEGPRDQAWAEIQRYAAQYAEDGPIEIWEITRRRIEGE